MRISILGSAVLFATIASGSTARAELPSEWPQFRGPGRDGRSTDVGLLETWPETGPSQQWRVAIGVGYSGMAIAAGRLFTMDADATREYALAVDATTGEEIWRTDIGSLFESYFGNGPRSTPTVDGDRAYVLGGRGRLVALQTSDGEVLWSRDFVQDFGSAIPEYGFGGSALVVDELLVIQPGGDGQAVVALDRSNGETIWSAHDAEPGYSSPLRVEVEDVPLLIFMTPRDLLATSVSGDVLWSHPFAIDQEIKPAMPLFIAPDLLMFSSGYDVGSIAIRVAVVDGVVVANEAWRNHLMRNHFNASVAVGDVIYGFDNATLKCLAAESGEERWAQRGSLGKGSLIYADGRLIVLSESGKLLLVEATPEEFREISSHQVLSGRCWTSPSIADGRLFLRNQREMVCLDLRARE